MFYMLRMHTVGYDSASIRGAGAKRHFVTGRRAYNISLLFSACVSLFLCAVVAAVKYHLTKSPVSALLSRKISTGILFYAKRL